MNRFARACRTAAVIVALCGAAQVHAAPPVLDDKPSAEAMALDLLIVRPLSLVGTILGIGIFAISLPINLLTFNLNDPAQALVIEPLKFTFTRDLGALE